ncbi:MAG TPA: Zn-dependent hydrolase, partial [Synergistaceae bacterium]|nr:Zn-dependent hydrolase [Synergistaceae bacterium]
TNAGALDGCYGVLSGLAVARAFLTEGVRPKRPLIVAAFTNEEGVRFQPDMMGSLAFAGGISAEEALAATDDEGRSLGSELERIGYAGEEPLPIATPGEYLELHVEQGPILDGEGVQIGVVEGVQGIWWWRITVRGTANHAGTTPLALRHDAGHAAARIVTFLREMAKATPATLATVGTMAFRPGSINVVPSEAVFTVDLRDPERARLLAAEEKIAVFTARVAEEEEVSVVMDQLVRFDPVSFDGGLLDLIEQAAAEKGFSSRRMASGAGHDAQMMARLCRSAMIFVPSRGGVSHSPAEHTEDDQLIRGAEVLLRVVSRLICP